MKRLDFKGCPGDIPKSHGSKWWEGSQVAKLGMRIEELRTDTYLLRHLSMKVEG